MASESSSHGPGGEIKAEGLRQHQTNARGEGPIKAENFGVNDYPGVTCIPGDRAMMGKTLSDNERGCGKTVPMGGGFMDASRNPDHGPHGVRK